MSAGTVLTPEKIKAIRADLGMTQAELAVMLGYSPKYASQAFHKLEKGIEPMPYAVSHLLLAIHRGYRPDTALDHESATQPATS